VAKKAKANARGVGADDLKIPAVVGGAKEDRLAIIATLCDVMGHARDDDTGTAGHTK